MKSLNRSSLRQPGETAKLLAKAKKNHIVFEVGKARFDARKCTGVAIDEAATEDNITFTRPGGAEPEVYNNADVTAIKRLRSHKYLIMISGAADPEPEEE